MMKIILTLMLFVTLGSFSSFAETEWTSIANIKTEGGVRTVDVNRQISKVAILCKEGNIVINLVEVIDGEKTIPFSVRNRLVKDETQQISVGDRINCSKLQITDEGKGEYEIRVKK